MKGGSIILTDPVFGIYTSKLIKLSINYKENVIKYATNK